MSDRIGNGSLAVALLAALVAWAGSPSTARGVVLNPGLEGPIDSPGSAFVQATRFDPSQVGYVQQEFFITGSASAYTNTAPPGR